MEYLSLCKKKHVPCQMRVIRIIKELRYLIFPGYFNCVTKNIEINNKKSLLRVRKLLFKEIKNASKLSDQDIDVNHIINQFIDSIPQIVRILKTDLEATFEDDPSAMDENEIILSYPGILAISIYRLAHLLYELDVPYIPRMMSEYAHSYTGIDIHPGANIGPYFFIDHGTGIVIGETTIIGHHVRIYQGVTLGALSLGRGHQLKGIKRHPTIGNYVTIYAGASILGGATTIGNNVTIGSNVYLLESVKDNMVVRLNKVELEYKEKDK